MSPKDVIQYIENKVISLPDVGHLPDEGKKAFFVIDDPYDFQEFDNALRNSASFPAVLCELVNGRLDENNAGSYTNSISVSFMVVDKEMNGERRIDMLSRTFDIGVKLLNEIRKDGRTGVVPGKSITVEMNSNYQPVGPLNSQFWGYQFDLSFTASFGWCNI